MRIHRTNAATISGSLPGASRAAVASPGASATIAKPATGGIVALSSVVKTYVSGTTQVRALRNVSLEVGHGEMLAIMGPSGCGKTTLLNCASGLDDIDAGRVTVAGSDIFSLSDKARTTFRARNMGFVFQTYNLLPVLSAVENVELPLIVSGSPPREARRRALEALETVALRHIAGNRPAQLSGGQRQRVTIARALVNRPDIVWADEPTGALDSETANDIMQLMETLNRENGLTFVIVTHDAGVGARCNRIIHMRDGQIVKEENLR